MLASIERIDVTSNYLDLLDSNSQIERSVCSRWVEYFEEINSKTVPGSCEPIMIDNFYLYVSTFDLHGNESALQDVRSSRQDVLGSSQESAAHLLIQIAQISS